MEYPPLFFAADAASGTGQTWYSRLAELNLVMLMGAALAAGIGSIGGHLARQVAAVAAALCLMTAILLRSVNQIRRPDRAWFDGRAVAESVKTSVWRFVMRAAPYGDDTSATALFIKELKETVAARPDLRLEPSSARTGQVTPGMLDARSLSFPDRRELYLRERVDDQMGWYTRRAKEHRTRGRTWFIVGLIAELLAVGMAVLRVGAPDIPNFVGFLTAVAASATAFAQLHRHDEVSRSYGLASQELAAIRSLLESAPEDRFVELVLDSEGAISREHTMWIAKRS